LLKGTEHAHHARDVNVAQSQLHLALGAVLTKHAAFVVIHLDEHGRTQLDTRAALNKKKSTHALQLASERIPHRRSLQASRELPRRCDRVVPHDRLLLLQFVIHVRLDVGIPVRA